MKAVIVENRKKEKCLNAIKGFIVDDNLIFPNYH